jgi:hypothetical protein
MKSLFCFTLIALFLCCTPPERTSEGYISTVPIDFDEHSTGIQDTFSYDTRVEIFELHRDSVSHLADYYLLDDKIQSKSGRWYHSVPFEYHGLSNYLIHHPEEAELYVSFDSMMCEVGGNSAYDSIIYHKDNQGRIIQVDHHMAWFESFDEETGEGIYDYTPDWFLGNVTKVEYEKDTVIRVENYYVEKDGSMDLEHEVVTFYDDFGRIVFQVWNQYAKTYNAYFYYE